MNEALGMGLPTKTPFTAVIRKSNLYANHVCADTIRGFCSLRAEAIQYVYQA